MLEKEGEIEIVGQTDRFEEIESLLGGIDVLVVSEESASPAALKKLMESEAAAAQAPAVLFITDNPKGLRFYMDLPLRAWGILSSEAGRGEIGAAVKSLAAGLFTASPHLIKPLLRVLSVQPRQGEQRSGVEQLTLRESEVLQLLALGMANKEIAGKLTVSENTVKFHLSSIYAKFGVTNRIEAVRLAIQEGMISL